VDHARAPVWADGWQQALAAVLAGGLIAGAGLVALAKGPGIERGLLGLAYLGVLVVLAVGDLLTRRAPNRLVYSALLFAVAASLTLGWPDAGEAILGGLGAFLVLLIVALVGRGAMGYGDVKVGALCGIAVGLHGVPAMLAITFVAGGIVAAALLVTRVRGRQDAVPFTPFLVAGTALSMSLHPLYLWG